MSKLLSELAKGAWDVATAYTIGDIVDHLSSSYICIANTTGNEPPNDTYWARLSTGIEWQGNWSAGTYTVKQAVMHNGSAWLATTTTTQEPSDAATQWDLLAAKGDTGATGSTGATGATGSTGPTGSDGVSAGLVYSFDDATTDSDPGNGNLRFNNATLASVTQLYLDDLESSGASVAAVISTWDDSTNTIRGTIIVRKVSDKSVLAVFSVTGPVTSATGYKKIDVTHVASNGSFADGIAVSVDFARAGNKGIDGEGAGDVVGPDSATDNALAVFDGVTGKLLKSSSFVPTTAGASLINLANPSAITFLRINADNTVTALSAADFKTAIGLVIGTNVQAWDADLDTWAGKTAPSGTVVGTSDTQTLSNKKFSDLLKVAQVATPSAPGAGDQILYAKTDGKIYTKTSADVEIQVGSGSFWTDVPGTPTRVSDTQFTITDTANANKYDLLFKKGVILKWSESGTFQTGMVVSSSYSSNTVTVNIVGDSLTAGFTAMQYAIPDISTITKEFLIAGTFPSAATTNLARTWRPRTPIYILSADLDVETAGSGSGSTVVDINVSGTTKFTTKPTLTTTGASDIDNVADNPSTEIAALAPITIDVDSVTATTAPSDGCVTLFYYPSSWRYR